jgi:hypothetical protein
MYRTTNPDVYRHLVCNWVPKSLRSFLLAKSGSNRLRQLQPVE